MITVKVDRTNGHIPGYFSAIPLANWCIEQGMTHKDFSFASSNSIFQFDFEKEQDAMLFILRWK